MKANVRAFLTWGQAAEYSRNLCTYSLIFSCQQLYIISQCI